ncbi:MAG: O-methyltransferase [Finegoldia sp.]|nr:O-methyltransferase [Finegoldia sp.]
MENKIVYDDVQNYIRDLSQTSDKSLIEMEAYAEKNKVPIIEAEVRNFLSIIVSLKKPSKILEIGTAIGYSSIVMKKAYRDSSITTIEIDYDSAQIAKENFLKYGYEDIKVINEDASLALEKLEEKFDLIFIDAAKGQYMNYFDLSKKLLNKGGLIVCDNVLFRGMVAHKELAEKRHRKVTIVKRLREFLEEISDSSKYETSIIPIDDGMSITRIKN